MTSRFAFTAVVSCFFGAAFAPPAAAQSSSPATQPSPPYLASVPERLHWIVTFTYPTPSSPGAPSAPPPADSPVSVEITKVGTTRRIVVKFTNGTTKQFDIIGTDCYTQLPSLGLQAIRMQDYVPYEYFDLGFPFTGSVKTSAYQGSTNYQGVPTFHYNDGSTEAWISVETRLPVGADLIGKVKTTYQYLPVPDVVVLTPEEQNALATEKRAAEIFNKLR
jgi:hypothetical protein